MADRTCTVEGCAKALNCRGMCAMHYYRLRRTGTTDQTKPWARRGGDCQAESCEKTDVYGGYCPMHYARLTRHGDTSVTLKDNGGRFKPRDEHPKWLGDAAKYRAVHVRLERLRGAAATLSCVDCGEQAYEWSYDGPYVNVRYAGPRGTVPFTHDVDDYVPRCRPCHQKHDREAATKKERA